MININSATYSSSKNTDNATSVAAFAPGCQGLAEAIVTVEHNLSVTSCLSGEETLLASAVAPSGQGPRPCCCEVVSVGTELLLGQITNTNAAFLGQELSSIGIFTYFTTVVGDNPQRLKEVLWNALNRVDIVITTGGLGPTYDDLTKETVAELLNLEMVVDEHSLDRIKEFFNKFKRQMTENNKKQAIMPKNSIIFDNDYGTAPALAIKTTEDSIVKNKIIIMLPGPPRELQPIFIEKIRPYLISQFSGNILHSNMLNVFGIGESAIEDKLYDLMKNSTNPTVAPYAKMGEVELRVTAVGKSIDECNNIMQPVIAQIQNTLGYAVYGINANSLQEKVVSFLKSKRLTLATAESCTGGYVGKRITDVCGASEVYVGGVVAYSNEIKKNILNVSAKTIEEHGAVSEQTAMEMAKGVAVNFASDIGISTTGIASATADTSKPVGLVYIGYYNKQTGDNYAIELNLARGYKDERESIRYLAASHALFQLTRF